MVASLPLQKDSIAAIFGINGASVFQYNKGCIVFSIITKDLFKFCILLYLIFIFQGFLLSGYAVEAL